ncbi:hypothetical protein [Silvimonas soli]|uniref:hypothetical protein n=1 Tax=Silvimonas soli TaxID=2980100 RepID=UPI0024B37FF0|nr:hypothetical protein [Silvimonas soli]
MQHDEAQRIITAFAQQPVLPARMGAGMQVSFDEETLKQALLLAAEALPIAGKLTARAAALPANAGKAWTEAEDQQLLAAFDEGVSVQKLATRHGRTRGGITAHLIRKGKLLPDALAPVPVKLPEQLGQHG